MIVCRTSLKNVVHRSDRASAAVARIPNKLVLHPYDSVPIIVDESVIFQDTKILTEEEVLSLYLNLNYKTGIIPHVQFKLYYKNQ